MVLNETTSRFQNKWHLLPSSAVSPNTIWTHVLWIILIDDDPPPTPLHGPITRSIQIPCSFTSPLVWTTANADISSSLTLRHVAHGQNYLATIGYVTRPGWGAILAFEAKIALLVRVSHIFSSWINIESIGLLDNVCKWILTNYRKHIQSVTFLNGCLLPVTLCCP